MSATIKTDHEGRFTDYTTRVLVDGDQDYAAADMLQVLGAIHDETGIDIELLPQVRGFCIVMLDQAGWEH